MYVWADRIVEAYWCAGCTIDVADLRAWRYRQAGPPLMTRQRRPYRCPSALNNKRKRMSARPWVPLKGFSETTLKDR